MSTPSKETQRQALKAAMRTVSNPQNRKGLDRDGVPRTAPIIACSATTRFGQVKKILHEQVDGEYAIFVVDHASGPVILVASRNDPESSPFFRSDEVGDDAHMDTLVDALMQAHRSNVFTLSGGPHDQRNFRLRRLTAA